MVQEADIPITLWRNWKPNLMYLFVHLETTKDTITIYTRRTTQHSTECFTEILAIRNLTATNEY